MQVTVDQVWATPSTLHMRVVVWADDKRWRHKYYCAVPFDDVDEHVLTMMAGWHMDQVPEEDHHQTALF